MTRFIIFPPIRTLLYINNAILITIIIFLVRKQHTQVVLQLVHTHTLQSICIHKLEEEYYYVLLYYTADLTICLSDHVLGRRSGRPIT